MQINICFFDIMILPQLGIVCRLGCEWCIFHCQNWPTCHCKGIWILLVHSQRICWGGRHLWWSWKGWPSKGWVTQSRRDVSGFWIYVASIDFTWHSSLYIKKPRGVGGNQSIYLTFDYRLISGPSLPSLPTEITSDRVP